jgi:hypothetical protein
VGFGAYGPFPTLEGYRDWVESVHAGSDTLFFAILDQGKPSKFNIWISLFHG